MEAFPYHHSYPTPYQGPSCLPERRNNIATDLKYANETDYANVLSMSHRLNHALSYPPASGRTPRHREFQVSRSHLQARTSPPAVRVASSSPRQHNASIFEYSSTFSAFPLPYRSQSATLYVPSAENSSPTIPLTSKDPQSYYSLPFQTSQSRSSLFDDSHLRTGSAGLPVSQVTTDSKLGIGYDSPPSWQARDPKWPQSRSHSRRKYVPKRRRYESPINQRHLGPRQGFLCPPNKKPFYHANGIQKRGQNHYRKKIPGFYDKAEKRTEQLPQPPRLARYPLPSIFPDDQKGAITYKGVSPSQYISTENLDTAVEPIRHSKYWEQMKEDPIFSNLSIHGELVSIKELIKRRDQILQDHTTCSIITKQHGSESDAEFPVFRRPDCHINASPGHHRRTKSPTQPKCNQTPSSSPHSPSLSPFPPLRKQRRLAYEESSTKDRNGHYRTASLTDTDTSRNSTPQQSARVTGLKRCRSDTEDDYHHTTSDKFHRRRPIDTVGSPSANRFAQRAPIYFQGRR